jgi:hypothetical protein
VRVVGLEETKLFYNLHDTGFPIMAKLLKLPRLNQAVVSFSDKFKLNEAILVKAKLHCTKFLTNIYPTKFPTNHAHLSPHVAITIPKFTTTIDSNTDVHTERKTQHSVNLRPKLGKPQERKEKYAVQMP